MLILTDVAGGTPFKMAVKASFGREDVTVVTGTNLPVVLQLAMLPEWTGVPQRLLCRERAVRHCVPADYVV